MKRVFTVSMVAFALAASTAVNAEAVTYTFTGTVIDTPTGIYNGIADGTTLTVTYTINYSNANPSQSYGAPGSTSASWAWENYGGSYYGTTAPTLGQYVFSSTLQVGSLSYATSPGSYQNESYMAGLVESGYDDQLTGLELSYSNSTDYTESFFQLNNYASPLVAPWTSAGEPVYVDSNKNVGQILELNDGVQSELDYTLSPAGSSGSSAVPLPAAAWLLLSGLGGLGMFARKRVA
jgi:hypothetical protein